MRLSSVLFEQGADGVVRRYAFEADHFGPDLLFVDLAAVTELEDIAFGLRQQFEEARLQAAAEEFTEDLHGARGIVNHLDGFDAREVEEPAAAGVHEHRVALHFE